MAEWFADVKAEFILNFIKEDRWRQLLNGLGVTIQITLISIVLGLIIGVVIATIRSTYDLTKDEMRGCKKTVMKILNAFARVYLTVIRGTPVVIQLLIIFFVIFASSTNGVMSAVIAFGINSGAYVAEIIRGGIMSIDKGQMEAGRSLGFNYIETMRYIIIPRRLKMFCLHSQTSLSLSLRRRRLRVMSPLLTLPVRETSSEERHSARLCRCSRSRSFISQWL